MEGEVPLEPTLKHQCISGSMSALDITEHIHMGARPIYTQVLWDVEDVSTRGDEAVQS